MPYALITGASKGIGKAIAFELAKHGHDLLLVSRSEQLLAEAAVELRKKYSVNVNYFVLDLSQRDCGKTLSDWCIKENFAVGILVSNAGYALWDFFETLKLEDQLNMMNLNMGAMVELAHYFIPLLKKNNPAFLLNVSSTTSFQAVPTMSVYAATKAFVLTFTRGLQYELLDSTVKVSCLIPGTTDSDFMNRANMDALKDFAAKFSMPPEEVARIAVKGMFKGQLEIIPGFSNIASAVGTKFLPKRVAEKIAAGIYLKRKLK